MSGNHEPPQQPTRHNLDPNARNFYPEFVDPNTEQYYEYLKDDLFYPALGADTPTSFLYLHSTVAMPDPVLMANSTLECPNTHEGGQTTSFAHTLSSQGGQLHFRTEWSPAQSIPGLATAYRDHTAPVPPVGYSDNPQTSLCRGEGLVGASSDMNTGYGADVLGGDVWYHHSRIDPALTKVNPEPSSLHHNVQTPVQIAPAEKPGADVT
jgi:hypothetical protein